MFLNDDDIYRLCGGFVGHPTSMIKPYNPACIREVNGERILSMGQAPCGYDAQLAPKLKLFKNRNLGTDSILDPKQFDVDNLITTIEGELILPPKTYALGETVETFTMPDNVMAICMAKSTYARCGISVNTTTVQPGFTGHVVLEIYNHLEVPVRLYPNEGFAFFLFLRSEGACSLNYADVGGNYMAQKSGIQTPVV